MEQYFVDTTIDQDSYILDDKEQFHHIITVLRHQLGDVIYLVDNNTNLFEATLANVVGKTAIFDVKKSDIATTELPIKVTIACALSKKDKVEWITQKSTELGATDIVFFNSQYSVMTWKGNVVDRKLERLQEIAKNAAQQSKRRMIPKVSYLNKFADLTKLDADCKLLAYEESAKNGETSALDRSLTNEIKSVIGVFGSEGGVSPDEVNLLQDAGYTSVGLGPRILRAETAPMYLLSVLSYNYELRMNEE
ncbi:RsmE family RNA methyltransferase [Companilactobacillus mishanensis]|uniref:RsmE family RNA methyltransferase n=1 Tax=Companilactobacillus mishanensis TaxID=2486008 RepID=UPI000F7B5962|nr:16S rRNA (uracil(1498)-N(3))-methyltransferase [Companilactobacillus mishanensis]